MVKKIEVLSRDMSFRAMFKPAKSKVFNSKSQAVKYAKAERKKGNEVTLAYYH